MRRYTVDNSGVVKFIGSEKSSPIYLTKDPWVDWTQPTKPQKKIKTKPNPKSSLKKKKKGKAVPQASGMVTCPYCKIRIRSDRKEKHITKVHQNQITITKKIKHHSSFPKMKKVLIEPDKKQPVRCNVCNIKIHPDLLKDHNLRYHNTLNKPVEITIEKSPVKQNNLTRERFAPKKSYSYTYDPRDGGKYLGFHKRDFDGKYGSMPIYDDYGEESGPE